MTLRFHRYLGIDYSGASTPDKGLPGLRVYAAEGGSDPVAVLPPTARRKLWSRRELAAWLVERLAEKTPTLVGIDHAFSVPREYFDAHGLPPDWDTFLDDFHRHWPTDITRVDALRDENARVGSSRWRRPVEVLTGAKSVFHFDVQGQVAMSTHAGLPWLRLLRRRFGTAVHFWPFDGWIPPAGRSVVAEVYPALWSAGFHRGERTPDQHDAFAVAARLQAADRDGGLEAWLAGPEDPAHRAHARVEGWILGVKSSHVRSSQSCNPG